MIDESPVLARTERLLYNEWKQSGLHLREYGSEFIGTAFLMFCIVGVVALMFGNGSPVPSYIPSRVLRLFFAGLLIGTSGAIVAVSPFGKLSGAHVNPAVSFGFYLLGKMHLRDTILYVISQIAGALLGAIAAHPVFSSLGSGTDSAALQPAPYAAHWGIFLAEAATTFVLTFAIYTCVSRKSLMQWTPVVVAIFAGILVASDGQYSGAGMNPARWIGPAALTHHWDFWAAYALAPLAGAAIAVVARMAGIASHPLPHTAKLYHDLNYRSIFKHDTAQTRLPKSVLKKHNELILNESTGGTQD